MNGRETFVTAINCMDGRVQLPVIEFLKKKFSVDYVDMITEAGPIQYLAGNSNPEKAESIRLRVEASVLNHDSKVVAIVGHAGCIGNPVEKDVQKVQIAKSVKLAKGWGYNVQFLSLFVNSNWEVEEL